MFLEVGVPIWPDIHRLRVRLEVDMVVCGSRGGVRLGVVGIL